jgi:peptidoglycan hydrolase CwlO-like protein
MSINNVIRKYVKKSKEDRERIKELKTEIEVKRNEINQIKAKYNPKV